MIEKTAACPNCDSARIRTNSNNNFRGPSTRANYSCNKCQERFANPVIREANGGSLTGLSKKLYEMEVEFDE